jgi:multidrug efflux system membrane fusion protein
MKADDVVSVRSVESQGGRSAPWRRWGAALVVAGLAGAGWATRGEWWPRVEPVIAAAKQWAFGKGGAAGGPGGAAKGQRVVAVTPAVVSRRDVPLYLTGLGTVTAYQTVTVRPRVEGELTKVLFTEGQTVKEGDLIAEIDARAWQAQVDQIEGQKDRDDAALRSATKTLLRYRQLLEAKQITPQEVDDQLALVEQAQAAVKVTAAQLENAELQLSYCKIKAPIGGRLGLRLVDVGNIVRPGDVGGIAVITQLQPIAVVFTIPQDEIPRLRRRMPGENGAGEKNAAGEVVDERLVVEAFNRDFRTKLASGSLAAFDNQVDSTTGTLRLKAVFANADDALFPNQFVNVRLLVETERDAIVVPTSALLRGPDSMFVYVIREDSTVERRSVRVGSVDGTETVIKEGLSAGEQVAVQGLDQLRDGAKVKVKTAGGGEKESRPGEKAANVAETPGEPVAPNVGKKAPVESGADENTTPVRKERVPGGREGGVGG